LQPFVAAAEARQRWVALRTFSQTYGHFLVSNGPYRLARWSADTVVLDVVRDISYPLGVGSYDRYAIPHRAYISQVEQHGQGLEIHAEVERVEKFQRTYEIVRYPRPVSVRKLCHSGDQNPHLSFPVSGGPQGKTP
jgi:hypothetical protein